MGKRDKGGKMSRRMHLFFGFADLLLASFWGWITFTKWNGYEVRILGIHAPADQFFGIIISLLMVLIMVYLSLWNFLRATED